MLRRKLDGADAETSLNYKCGGWMLADKLWAMTLTPKTKFGIRESRTVLASHLKSLF